MTRTEEIAKLLGVSLEVAEKVHDLMDESGIDYSDCEQSEFDSTARECYEEYKKVEIACPDCQSIDDDQYTCTTCWCQGGNGVLPPPV